MIRSIVYRNALSGLLFLVAVAGIAVQLRQVHEGLVFPQTRFVLVSYVLVAIYAIVSIVVRIRAPRDKR